MSIIKALGMVLTQLNVKHHGKEAALSGFILVQSELISLLRLTDMYHGITQRLLGGFGSNFLSFMKRRKQDFSNNLAYKIQNPSCLSK